MSGVSNGLIPGHDFTNASSRLSLANQAVQITGLHGLHDGLQEGIWLGFESVARVSRIEQIDTALSRSVIAVIIKQHTVSPGPFDDSSG